MRRAGERDFWEREEPWANYDPGCSPWFDELSPSPYHDVWTSKACHRYRPYARPDSHETWWRREDEKRPFRRVYDDDDLIHQAARFEESEMHRCVIKIPADIDPGNIVGQHGRHLKHLQNERTFVKNEGTRVHVTNREIQISADSEDMVIAARNEVRSIIDGLVEEHSPRIEENERDSHDI
ncbi:hypothetical protein CYMTET_54246 [Cymbomonas tetramitiformis]|uniref:K Homology domain-containing protein n=1 Tax=Cymbomonas tetramitiformis TaxID=36881 RepID=A0AAE0EPI7_9CHLO|nr:hypothetical protein CYMTET_54246 [Cymbomonas tetramitiformis]